jgi:cytochrome bd ubiquinol oxidase subunit II
MDLDTVWFLLVTVLVAGYAVLDGFDLGVGVLHLFARDEEERRLHLAAVGPPWDGKEVWLLTAAGALLAFPAVRAHVPGGLVLALALLVASLLFRAVSLELRRRAQAPGWQRCWDVAFGVGSLLAAPLFGVAVGNLLRGLPADGGGTWRGSLLVLLNPYSLAVGLLSLALFVMHGALYLRMRSGGALAARLRRWAARLWFAFVGLYALATGATTAVSPGLFTAGADRPLWWGLLAVMIAALIWVFVANGAGNAVQAFLASATTVAAMIGLAAASAYPVLMPSPLGAAHHLTIHDASTPGASGVTLVVALVGTPLVIASAVAVYRTARRRAGAAVACAAEPAEAAQDPARRAG